MTKRIALIGVGRMGSGIAANILKGGMQMNVWNRTPSKVEPLINQGAVSAATPRQAAENADVVVTSLMDDKSILETMRGGDGLLAGMRKGTTHICVTTISPAFGSELEQLHREHGTRYVSGPVVGRPDAALAGTLTSYLAGDAAAIEAVRDVAETYSKFVNVVPGPAGAANTIKLCINYTVVSIIEIIGEVYAFAEKGGVDGAIVNEFYQAAFAHPALKLYGNKILNRDFSQGGFALSGGLKDVNLMLEAARENGAILDVGNIVREKMMVAIESGMAERDWSVLTETTRSRAGLR